VGCSDDDGSDELSAPDAQFPAFPVSLPGCGDNGWHGMSLRDYMATSILAALIVADGAQYFSRKADHAQLAYAQADVMLIERAKGFTLPPSDP